MSEYVDYLKGVFVEFRAIQPRRMFGGYGLFHKKLMFGLVADDVWYLKADEEVSPFIVKRRLKQFQYRKNGKIQNILPEQLRKFSMVLWKAKGVFTLKPRISLITIGVEDLERSLRFYRDGLGFATEGIIGTEFEYGAVAFFELEANLRLAIYPRKSLSKDSGVPLSDSSATEFSLGHNVSSKTEVNAVMYQAKEAGAIIVKAAQDTFYGGYAGFFQDPDGHLWEVAWNPNWAVPD